MTVYNDNESTIKGWINKDSEEGRNKNSSIYFKGDIIYSYGVHFPLAVRKNRMYLVNGDRYSITTSKHQGFLFILIPNSRRIQIPFSALERAYGYEEGVSSIWVNEERVKETETLDWECDDWVFTGRYDENGEKIYQHVLGGALFEYNGSYYLSGIDVSGKDRGLYFLTKLLDNPKSMVEAYNSLKPDEVKNAEKEGTEVKRQGEFFFIKETDQKWIDLIEDMIKRIGGVKGYVLEHKENNREARHYATIGFKLPDSGRQYVKGVIRHPEHRELKLYESGTKEKDRTWWRVIENNQEISFNANGGVD